MMTIDILREPFVQIHQLVYMVFILTVCAGHSTWQAMQRDYDPECLEEIVALGCCT